MLCRPDEIGKLEFDAAHVIGPAAESVGDRALGPPSVPGAVISEAHDARTDATDVEATQIGTEETVGQPNGVAPGPGDFWSGWM